MSTSYENYSVTSQDYDSCKSAHSVPRTVDHLGAGLARI